MVEKEPHHQNQQSAEGQSSLGEKASSLFKENARQGDTFFTTAVLFADHVRTYVTNYPDKDKVLPEPPLNIPYGFLEGAEVGVLTYVTLKPIQTKAMNYMARTPSQFSSIRNPVGVLLIVGQFMVSAQMALYATVRKGSYTWLSTLEDFATVTATKGTDSSAEEVTHKSAIADILCQDPLLVSFQQQLAKGQKSGVEIATTTAQKGDPPSILDWVKGPNKVVVDQMALALAACNSRKA